MRRALLWVSGMLLLAVQAVAQHAADSLPRQPISIVEAREAAELARVIEAPVRQGTSVDMLRRHFVEKTVAARRLGNPTIRERVLREAMQHLPEDARWANDLGVLMHDAGRFDESQRLYETAIARERHPVTRLFFESNLMSLLVARSVVDAAEQVARVRRSAESMLPGLSASLGR